MLKRERWKENGIGKEGVREEPNDGEKRSKKKGSGKKEW